MDISFFQFFWYCIVYVALTAFATLDGFDLGVGILHLTARNDKERRIYLNAIGPVWDGNAVWLIIVAGGLLAGFPQAFATIFSSYYLLVIILLGGIIFRAVAIEFRSKKKSSKWRNTWDVLFFLSSLIITTCVGFILAGLIAGLPVGEYGIFRGTLGTYFTFYTFVFAITVISLFAMHGAIYLMMKTEDALQKYVKKWSLVLTVLFLFCTTVLTLCTWFLQHQVTDIFIDKPWLLFIAGFGAISSVLCLYSLYVNWAGRAFIFSSGVILSLYLLCAIGNFPYLVRSTINSNFDLTIANASSSPLTLWVLFLIVAIGVPFVLGYSVWLYRTFKGKVKLDSHSY